MDAPGLAFARAYATRLQWPVFPVHAIRAGACTCGKKQCDRQGKHPVGNLVPHGLKDASTDPDQLTRWWTRAPWANVGIPTGAVSGFFVLDVDAGHGGFESLDALVATHGPLPPTVTARTGGGGIHLLFRHPGRPIPNKLALKNGLDVRADGGYIVAPPSVHASGGTYAWAAGAGPADLAPADAPAWLLDLILYVPPPAPTPAPKAAAPANLETRARAYLSAMAPAVSGQGGHSATWDAAVAMVRGFNLDPEAALAILVADYNPRCNPPWSERELRHKVQDALQNGQVPFGYLADAGRPTPAPKAAAPPAPAPRPDDQAPQDEQLGNVDRDGRLAILLTGTPQRDVMAQGWLAILLRNDPPRYFRLGRELVQVDERARETVPIGRDGLVRLLAECANWYRVDEEKTRRNTGVPMVLASPMLTAIPSEFPELVGLATVPAFTGPDWVLRTTTGYDPASLYYYAGQAPPAADLEPWGHPDTTSEDARNAAQYLTEDWLGDFPFASDTDRNAAVALALTLLARGNLSGRVPAFLVEAATPGTGKSTLCESIVVAAYGRLPEATMGWPNDDVEAAKLILSLLREGRNLLYHDNCTRLAGNVFAGLVTNGTVTDRLLGTNTTATVPFRGVLVANGLNPSVSAEAGRRMVRCRLQPPSERPWYGRTFRHPDLLDWTRLHRAHLLAALATLVAWWRKAGAPKSTGVLAGFESWAAILGGIIEAAGLGPLVTEETVASMYERSEETDDLATFVDTWRLCLAAGFEAAAEGFVTRPVRAAVLVEVAQGDHVYGQARTEKGLLLAHVLAKPKAEARASALGRYLTRIAGRVVNGYRIVATKEPSTGHSAWALVQVTED